VYEVPQMKTEIEQAVAIAERKVRDEFRSAFETIYRDGTVPTSLPASEPPISMQLLNC
jgi:hypothetical protein